MKIFETENKKDFKTNQESFRENTQASKNINF
jgi:hypothetical protein